MIYTKTGDKGTTSLIGGRRVPKCCDRLESYGTIDELNSHIGMLAALCKAQADAGRQPSDGTPPLSGSSAEETMPFVLSTLARIQQELFAVGGWLATDTSATPLHPSCIVTEEMVGAMEQAIDHVDALLPKLRSFVIPGGTVPAAQAHICRTVCRRAERNILRLAAGGTEIDGNLAAYVNRLSDFFFVLARLLAG
ncbi:MAG: cob(I)yrinic acid a,c-diamide adenosyltransferase [Bacteroidales bacterium]|nr:cob(I)yrinic acid a,c-diamide adenosyltransferase [Bacteroidales bacterium]MCM1146714.1 cob(I)yrinic acid a,c-diamide adenosyltransferase [Bacteroidales bacterium]MCM1205531.1 cob(I)yrinic acid a,c-diamide adenosyltransferase [Bacillota bacterium]MCM1509207.1 cob(I)yrinic acid a,c-diamide adenosyltransferase [Clostridium sp.]